MFKKKTERQLNLDLEPLPALEICTVAYFNVLLQRSNLSPIKQNRSPLTREREREREMGRRNSRRAISKDTKKKKLGSSISETLISCKERRGKEDSETGVTKEGKGGFFACYLLTSLSPRHKGRTYIGFTVNPRRRIRQHNGEIGSGASRTKSRRPWEMVFCIYGFPTHVSALQFEWAWQHPRESLAVREAAATLKSLTGLANKIRLGYKMLTLPAWENLKLTVNFFSTKYTKHSAGCPSLPKHMRVQVCSLDELPCYTGTSHNNIFEDEDEDEMCKTMSSENGSRSEGSTVAEFEDEDERHDDEMCKTMSSENGCGSEGSTVAEFGDWRRTIEETTCNQNGVGKHETIGRRQSGDLLSSTEGDRPHPLFTAPTPVHESSSVTTSSFSESEGSKNRETVILIEENNGVELDRLVRAVGYDEPSILTSSFSESEGSKNRETVILIEENNGVELDRLVRAVDYDEPSILSSSFSESEGSKNRETVILIEENNGVELDRLVRAVDYDEPSILTSVFPCEADVIDLLSPSPVYRIRLGSKKRKVSDVGPETIDLTKSPIFI
ncbi:hypothetical protein RHGRI_002599 [Rhododendron griersonianum]|uniref:Structure-specific endonuclease subunit SLX1 homolog n=1 Tax=Rhododendron griersonianum TaxID=479676 RepID=A0AAV6LSI5_9ERIC|nr:hypothetical protein RHGRI_002599 [Rhododendron griersonianum]